MICPRFLAAFLSAALLSLSPLISSAEDARASARLELGVAYQARNKVQAPNDDEGTRYSLEELAGSGPWPAARLELDWEIRDRHGLRVVLAPFAYSERGRLDKDVRFEGESYNPEAPVRASYKFNSWRLGYRYNFYDRDDWQLWVGGTLKLRDAEIELEQGAVRSDKEDFGVVPLLYLAARYRIAPDWHVAADFDGLAGGPGRAIDFSARLEHRVNDAWQLAAGYRALEGGADIDEIYNFAWFNTAFVAFEYRF